MDIKPYDKTIRDLLLSKRQFVIPRFQREYSWEKSNYKEFFDDMIGNLSVKDGKIMPNSYFLGTMLFVGNFTEGTEIEIEVVDGQQRLTTITILFSAMAEVFKQIGENDLATLLFQYIMTKDDNGKEVRILKSKSHYPYFAYFIQDQNRKYVQEPNTDEENCIKTTYEYFISVLKEKKLKDLLEKTNGREEISKLSLVDILKALRDQVLNTTFVSISTSDEQQANKIFEILNAKGKKLAHIDLIKNKLFEVLDDIEPADYAEEQWRKLKNILFEKKEQVGLGTFYRHYWISKYKKSSESKLYDDFLAYKISSNKDKSKDFLDDMIINAKYYTQILNPNRADYGNRKEYFWLVQSLNALGNYFNIVQVRTALMALYDLKQKDLISLKKFKSTIQYLEGFHFAYNAVLARRANKFEKIYSTFAIAVRNCVDKESVNNIINDKLISALEKIYPNKNDFCEGFIKLSYKKENEPFNTKTKYAINKLSNYYSQNEIFEDDGTIEHIIPESEIDDTINVGNLILIEKEINLLADNKDYINKIEDYKSSNYVWIKHLIKDYKTFTIADVHARAANMAEIYYDKVLGRNV